MTWTPYCVAHTSASVSVKTNFNKEGAPKPLNVIREPSTMTCSCLRSGGPCHCNGQGPRQVEAGAFPPPVTSPASTGRGRESGCTLNATGCHPVVPGVASAITLLAEHVLRLCLASKRCNPPHAQQEEKCKHVHSEYQ